MRLVVCGDSWAWGAELLDPSTGDRWGENGIGHSHHFLPAHEEYRLKHKYPTLLAEKLKADETVDLSMCSVSNDFIFRTLLDWLATEGYLQGRDTSDLFISIGWTSPERTEFYYKNKWGDTFWAPFGPWQLDNGYFSQQSSENEKADLHEFFRLYMDYFCNKTEFMHRYARQVWMLQFIFKKLNIHYVMHQAFYHEHSLHCHQWNDMNYWDKNKLSPIDKFFWNDVDEKHFIFKDDMRYRTFHGYVNYQSLLSKKQSLAVFHPNAYGHELWAEKLYNHIMERELWTQ